MIATTQTMTPILKWTGGKFNQAEVYTRVKAAYEPFRKSHNFFEPFCGGLGMTLRVNANNSVCNDINSDLISFYRAIQRGYQWEPEYSLMTYKDLVKRLDNPTAFYLVNKTSFNGLFRRNSKGGFNTPGNGRFPKDVALPDLKLYKDAFRNIEFTSNQWFKNLNPISDNFYYLDPPYFGTYSGYTKDRFKSTDHISMINKMLKLPQPCLISNSANPALTALYDHLEIRYETFVTSQSFGNSVMIETLAYINC